MLFNRYHLEEFTDKKYAHSIIVHLARFIKPTYKSILGKRKDAGKGNETFVCMSHYDLDEAIEALSQKTFRKKDQETREHKVRILKKLKNKIDKGE